MATKSKKKTAEKQEEAVLEVKAQEVAEEPVKEETVPKAEVKEEVKEITVKVYRDGEGRLVLAQEGKPKRIAGSDDAFPEVARQFASDFIKERQI